MKVLAELLQRLSGDVERETLFGSTQYQKALTP